MNPEWDAFVDQAPGGHHVQTTLWARAKAVLGWRAARIVLYRDGRIVAGCQVLLRDLPGVGAIAYAPRGPLVDGNDRALIELVLSGLHELASRERILLLKTQPPAGRWDIAEVLEVAGLRPSELDAGPTATVLVNLRRPTEEILAGMRAGTRSNVRKAERKGVIVRVGREDDFEAFAALVEGTSRRQGFVPYPARYYRAMWELFAPTDHACLLLAEHGGQPLSAVLLLAYGDSAIYKMGGWSGERGTIHPNELLHWNAMQWARERGYRTYDLEGIPIGVARALLRGEAPEEARRGTAHFKLGLGGEVTLFPGAYDYAYRPLLAHAIARLAPRLSNWRGLAHRLLGRGG